jgi:hypothetical protein
MLNKTKIISRQNESSEFSGMDCIEHCFSSKKDFQSYPYTISYQYNSRGFRDVEWPSDHFQEAIWCVGDSFTSGVGVPWKHTWPQVLQQKTNRRTINISLDGASNNWIARHANEIIKEIQPQYLIVQWSFSHRREADISVALDPIWQEYYNNIKDPSWPDCSSYKLVNTLPIEIQNALHTDTKFNSWADDFDLENPRRLLERNSTVEEDIANTQSAIDLICSNSNTKIIHSFIPNWHRGKYQLNFYNSSVIPKIEVLDLGRDGFHYDIKTATKFVDLLLPLLT